MAFGRLGGLGKGFGKGGCVGEGGGLGNPAYTLPTAIYLDRCNATTGWTNSNTANFPLTIDTNKKVEGTGSLRTDNNGVTGSANLTKTTTGVVADPDALGVIVFSYDCGEDPEYQNASSMELRLGRAGTYYSQASVTGPTGMSTATLGQRWNAYNVSEVSTLVAAALPSGAIDIRSIVAASGAGVAPYAGTARFDALVANAAGRPTVILTFDDIAPHQYSFALPQMQARGLKGNLFVPKDLVNTQYSNTPLHRLNLAELAEIYAAGWDFGVDGTTDDNPMTGMASAAAAVASAQSNQAFLTTNGWTRGINHGCYPNGSTQTAGTKVQVASATSDGSAVVLIADTTGILVGMRAAGFQVPASPPTTVLSIVANVSVTLSASIPAQTKPMSFTDTSGPFHTWKLQTALKAAGFKSFRITNNGTAFDRFGYSDQHIVMPAASGSAALATDLYAWVTQAKLRGTTAMFYFHIFDEASGLSMDGVEFQAFLDLLKADVDANLIDVLTLSQWESRCLASTVPA